MLQLFPLQMLLKRTLIMLVGSGILFINQQLRAQEERNVSWEKENFPKQVDDYHKAHHEFTKGQHLFRLGVFYYKEALLHLEVAAAFNPNNALVHYYIGRCVLETVHKEEAIRHLEKAFQLDSTVTQDIYFAIAQAHQINEDWDLAILNYRQFEHQMAKDMADKDAALSRKIRISEKHIQECHNGKLLSASPVNVTIRNIGPPINTPFDEYGVNITEDGKTMFFTARKPGGIGAPKSEDVALDHHQALYYYEDIYVTHQDEEGQWSTPYNLGRPINTPNNEATVSLSPDGKSILFYATNGADGNLYEAQLEGETWSKPKRFDHHISSHYHESSAVYSQDKKRLFFVSSNPKDNLGGEDQLNEAPELTHDIFYSDWDEKHQHWKAPVNIGPTLNTAYNERGVFLHADGKTMYFSSEGHNSMGGYDLFKTVYDSSTATWSPPENLGYPINGPDDNIYFVLSGDGKIGYYSSEHKDAFGREDIYEIHFHDVKTPAPAVVPDTPVVAVPKVLRGTVLSAEGQQTLKASVIVTNLQTGQVEEVTTDMKDGRFALELAPQTEEIVVSVTAAGFESKTSQHQFATDDSPSLAILITLDPVPAPTVAPTPTFDPVLVYFAHDHHQVLETYVQQLDSLYQILVAHPAATAHITGHTDNSGPAEYNRVLSEKRARYVQQYLVQKGASTAQLLSKGLGETQPIADNATSAGRQKNRRVEVWVGY